MERDENFFSRPSRETKSRDETRSRRSRLVSSRLFSRRDRLVTGPTNPHFPFLFPQSPPLTPALRFVSEARGDCTAGMGKKVRKKYCTKKRATIFRSKSAVYCRRAPLKRARHVPSPKKEANCHSTTTVKQVPRSGTSRLQTVATAQGVRRRCVLAYPIPLFWKRQSRLRRTKDPPSPSCFRYTLGIERRGGGKGGGGGGESRLRPRKKEEEGESFSFP